jgi:nucleoid DNA-binding protein
VKKTPARKMTAIKEPMTKTAILTDIADNTELTKKQVQAVFDELAILIQRHVAKRGAGMFTLPGLLKITVARKPATKARKGINPFTGEETVFKAKPARNVVKVRPLKKLKDMVA